MTENTKTLSFVAAAALLAGAAWITIPRQPQQSAELQIVGTKLFKFDPAAVDSLKVLQFDQKGSQPIALEVAKHNSLWVLPTHGNYPADAKDHLAAAANSLNDLQILGLAPGFSSTSQPPGDDAKRAAYNQFGVVDPDPDTVKSTDTGIGTRITMKDAAGKELASAIVGKAVPDQYNQCYIRVAGKEPVYIVALDPTKLTVKFADWIEPNLLNLNSMDLKQVDINDYSIERVVDPDTRRSFLAPVPNGQYTLDLPDNNQPWKLIEDLGVDLKSGKLVPRKLAADEELNTSALDGMKSALEDLKIVDVERKPAQIPADLRVHNLDQATAEMLMERGYYPAASNSKKPDSTLEILSKFGEIRLQLNDGARYILRFGNTTGASSGGEKDKKSDTSGGSSPGMDRYLFVMADFNQDAITKPAVEQLPPEEKPAAKADAKKSDDKKPDDKKPEEKKIDAKDAKATDPAKAADAKKDDVKKEDVKKEEPKKAEAKTDEPKRDDAAEKAKARQAEQERIDKENKRRRDEYEAKVAAGKKHVEELNKRFAQWYYVIPGDVYEKIHLDRKAIVKKKEPPKDEHAHDHDGGAGLSTGPLGTLDKLPDVEKK